MKKKILFVSILAVFMLVAISYATAVSTNTANTERKESPLFSIRTRRAITEKIGKIVNNIKTRFLGERAFFIPFQFMRNKIENYPLNTYIGKPCTYEETVCKLCSALCPPN